MVRLSDKSISDVFPEPVRLSLEDTTDLFELRWGWATATDRRLRVFAVADVTTLLERYSDGERSIVEAYDRTLKTKNLLGNIKGRSNSSWKDSNWVTAERGEDVVKGLTLEAVILVLLKYGVSSRIVDAVVDGVERVDGGGGVAAPTGGDESNDDDDASMGRGGGASPPRGGAAASPTAMPWRPTAPAARERHAGERTGRRRGGRRRRRRRRTTTTTTARRAAAVTTATMRWRRHRRVAAAKMTLRWSRRRGSAETSTAATTGERRDASGGRPGRTATTTARQSGGQALRACASPAVIALTPTVTLRHRRVSALG